MATYVSSSAAGGTSIFTIVYGGIILGKIFGFITWSWFWILFPITTLLVILTSTLIIWIILELHQTISKNKRK